MGIKVNKLSSTKTQLPYDYYSLPFCKPPTIVNSAENLGEASLSRAAQCLWRSTSRARYTQVLRGDRIENSVYTVRVWRRQRSRMHATPLPCPALALR